MTDIVNEDVLDTDEPELTEYTSESDTSVSAEPKRAPASRASARSNHTGSYVHCGLYSGFCAKIGADVRSSGSAFQR